MLSKPVAPAGGEDFFGFLKFFAQMSFFQTPFSDTLKKELSESVTLTQNIFKQSDFCF